MRFVESSSYTTIIPNYCRLLARYRFKSHHYHLIRVKFVSFRAFRVFRGPCSPRLLNLDSSLIIQRRVPQGTLA